MEDGEYLIDQAIHYFDNKIEDYTNQGSNWIVQKIDKLIVKIVAV